jgi:AcrR family transcriptional regulator
VAKGSFFHHFKDKEALALAAADYWSEMTGAFFETAPYHKHKDPLERVLGYIDFRKSILKGALAEFTCLVGMMVQEVYASNPAIRDACDASISGHAAKVEADIAEAMKLYGAQNGRPKASRCTRKPFCKGLSFWPRPRVARRSPPPVSITCAATSSFCSNPQSVKERRPHEHEQHISRCLPWQQNQPANDSMERPSRS